LVNLKSLKKRRGNKYDTDDSDTEDSSDVGKNKSRKVTKKDKNKEQEQKLINFFNQMDDDGKMVPKALELTVFPQITTVLLHSVSYREGLVNYIVMSI